MKKTSDAARESVKFGCFGSALQLLTRKAELERELEDIEAKLARLRKLWWAVKNRVDAKNTR